MGGLGLGWGKGLRIVIFYLTLTRTASLSYINCFNNYVVPVTCILLRHISVFQYAATHVAPQFTMLYTDRDDVWTEQQLTPPHTDQQPLVWSYLFVH